MLTAETERKAPFRFGTSIDPREAAARGLVTRRAKAEAGILDTSKLKKLSSQEWYDLYTSRAFPGPWARYYNHVQRQFLAYYKAATGREAPQYKTLCWRAAALSTCLAMMEVAPDVAVSDKMRVDQRLIECIGQLQKYTESEKHESVVIDATKERVLSLVIAVADHVLGDEAKPALFAALRRVIAGGEFDPAKAISMLVAASDQPRGAYLNSTSRPLPPGDRVDVLSASDETTPEPFPDSE